MLKQLKRIAPFIRENQSANVLRQNWRHVDNYIFCWRTIFHKKLVTFTNINIRQKDLSPKRCKIFCLRRQASVESNPWPLDFCTKFYCKSYLHYNRFFEIKILRPYVGFEPTQPIKPKEDKRAVSTAIVMGRKTKQYLFLLFKKQTTQGFKDSLVSSR